VIQIWGRDNSVNVRKVLWCCDELGLPFERIDAGMQFGRNQDPEYLALNPNGKVPLLVDGDFSIWESNSIIRYLALQHGQASSLYPAEPKLRASIDKWLDWSLSSLAPAERPMFWGLVRTAPAERDQAVIDASVEATSVLWAMLDRQLEGRAYVEGGTFTLADLVLGCFAQRWYGMEGFARPVLANLARWHDAIRQREGYKRYLAGPLT
jgi:glutathione S-transferase